MDDSMPRSFDSFTHFAGFDWGQTEHQIVVVDRLGKILLSFRFKHDAQGWASLRQKLQDYQTRLAVSIETSCGPAVERLLEINLAVYPMNPKAAERYRDRKSPGGVKSDERDAWSFADALRSDGHGWRPLRPEDELTAELRMLCRDEIGLIELRTALSNQLQAALLEYYQAALEAELDWTTRSAWQFVLTFPAPADLVQAGRRKHNNFLQSHKLYRPQTAEKRLAIFADAEKFASPNHAVTRAKSLLAVTLAKQLLTLEDQLDQFRQRIQTLFNNHPDSEFFGSLPGAGPKLAPRLLSELGTDQQRFESPDALRCYAGTAPVLKQSGKTRFAVLRRACNPTLRATVHLWANLSRTRCAWAQTYYQHKKSQGLSHAAALRCLGQRWLKILWKMWREKKPYDEARHTRNQVNHGSWVIGLIPQTNPATTP